jgi:DNA mismatch repair protein MutL
MPSPPRRPILRLSPSTASRIAAGEVVERPLSALKELLENALDAGARAIEVRVDRSLDHFFSVADDGSGMAADELDLALERHATSKIASLEDLDRLVSLGFRGEALPSIAAVSRLRITSRPEGAEAASYVVCEGGMVTERGTTARAPGTTVDVANLFYNTPARRKFQSSPAGELRAAMRLIEACALAWPEVGWRLVVDGRDRLGWPAASTTRERLASIRGARHAEQLLEAEGGRGGIEVRALLGLPEHARATREGQVFLVNRRWIQSPLLGAALRQAYGNLLPGGRFPSATVWLRVPPDRLDVNVHPTKREVRFADEDAVFGALAAAASVPLAHIQPPFTVVRGGASAEWEPRWADRVREAPDQTWLALEVARPAAPAAEGAAPVAGDAPPADGGPAAPARAAAAADSEAELWQLHRTYILAPVRGGLVLIDQHAAHERILYEQALERLRGGQGSGQQLLFPAIADLSTAQFELLLELGPWLEQLGWDLRPLGPPTVVIQGVPAGVHAERPGQLLQDVLDGVSDSTGRHPHEDVAEHLARSWACHAAVRAGDPLSLLEMRTLVDRLFATTRPHGDPHGRVTFVRLDLDEIHRRFGRT